jgi:uncharacterized protein (DUF2236 family)
MSSWFHRYRQITTITIPTDIKDIMLVTALLVYAYDVKHIYDYVTNYYIEDDEFDLTKGNNNNTDRGKEDLQIMGEYSSNCNTDAIVSREKYEQCLDKFTGGKIGIYESFDDPSMKVTRESIVFAGGGRAAFLQLAHPFVAAGIRLHSQLENGVRRRFINTFKYMFAMSFGTREEILKASKTVRSLHDRVRGEIGEDVGIFTRTSKFDAAQEHAMKWVAATLLETSIFEYEMFIGPIPEEEKDLMVIQGENLALLFGIQPNNMPRTWKDFRRMNSVMWRSKLLTVSESAKDTAEFLLLPPGAMYAPLLRLIWWSTAVQLPPRIAKQFYGRIPSWFDRVLFALFHAQIRFIYRITPTSFRYLSAYLRMRDRILGDRWIGSRILSRISAVFTNKFLDMAMPPRDPVEARRKVAELRETRVEFENVKGSPIKVRG